MNKVSRFYLAYGSNLNMSQMERRCPDAEAIGWGHINGYHLIYRGSGSGYYLSIEPGGKSEYVPVAVFRISKQDERALDWYEGYPRFYKKKIFRELPMYRLDDNRVTEIITGMAYVLPTTARAGLPSKHYVEICEQGYRDFGFSRNLLTKAIETTWEALI